MREQTTEDTASPPPQRRRPRSLPIHSSFLQASNLSKRSGKLCTSPLGQNLIIVKLSNKHISNLSRFVHLRVSPKREPRRHRRKARVTSSSLPPTRLSLFSHSGALWLPAAAWRRRLHSYITDGLHVCMPRLP